MALAADCVVAVGLAFSVWARVALGRNWSAEVTFKEGHELVASGPYGLVRHPIYTGLLLMGLGTAINYGRVVGFAVFVAVCVACRVEGPSRGADHECTFPGGLR